MPGTGNSNEATELLNETIRRLDVTQAEIAKGIGMHQSELSRMLSGHRPLRVDHVKDILEYLADVDGNRQIFAQKKLARKNRAFEDDRRTVPVYGTDGSDGVMALVQRRNTPPALAGVNGAYALQIGSRLHFIDPHRDIGVDATAVHVGSAGVIVGLVTAMKPGSLTIETAERFITVGDAGTTHLIVYTEELADAA